MTKLEHLRAIRRALHRCIKENREDLRELEGDLAEVEKKIEANLAATGLGAQPDRWLAKMCREVGMEGAASLRHAVNW